MTDPRFLRKLGSRECGCATCGRIFGGEWSFDLYRVGRYEPDERRCLSDAELEDKGMRLKNGAWIRQCHLSRMPLEGDASAI